MPGTDSTYAPRSPDLSSFYLPPNNSNINSSTSAYHGPQTQSSSSARGQGYTPRSPRISPQNDLERTPSINDRRTSYVPPTLQNYASKSPEVVNFQRRHSAYIPPSDLPALNTSYSSNTQPTYTSPTYTRQQGPPQGTFTNPPSTQYPQHSYSIPQSALTYQAPIKTEERAQTFPSAGEFKPPFMRDLNLSDNTNSTTPERKMEVDNSTFKMEGEAENVITDLSAVGASKGIEVKTKFPVARIKRIMQADEEVGKVAQVTPVVVSKALELFMISLVSKSADLARAGNSKRVTAVHLKKAIEADEQFDFLNDIVSKVAEGPDAGQEKSKRGKSEEGSESEEKPKRKRGGRAKRGD